MCVYIRMSEKTKVKVVGGYLRVFLKMMQVFSISSFMSLLFDE